MSVHFLTLAARKLSQRPLLPFKTFSLKVLFTIARTIGASFCEFSIRSAVYEESHNQLAQ